MINDRLRFSYGAAWIVILWALGLPGRCFAQPVIPAEDARVGRLLASLDDLIAGEQWSRAAELIDQVVSAERERVVPVRDGHLLNAAEAVRVRLGSGLPAPLLELYRSRWEPRAQLWLEEARAGNRPDLLLRIVEETFATRAAEEALLLLGEHRLQEARFAEARRYWTMLIPWKQTEGSPVWLLRYPDPQTPTADVLARLVLCSLLEGDRERAEGELAVFVERYPDATGTLAGRSGRWADLLRDVRAREFAHEVVAGTESGVATYQGSFRRNGISPAPLDVGAIQWSLPIAPDVRRNGARENPTALRGANVFPVEWNGLLFIGTGDRIEAYNLETGQPAWMEDAAPRAADLEPSVLFPSHAEPPRAGLLQRVRGSQAETLTIAEGRLYARLGGPVTSVTPQEVRAGASRLVCLDLEFGQGLLRWERRAEDLNPDLRFEGAPVVADGRAYLLARQNPRPVQLHLICFDADTGEFLWNREICSGSLPAEPGENFASSHLLALAGDRLLIDSELGAIAACDVRAGRPLWFQLYSRDESPRPRVAGKLAASCFVEGETVFALPADGHELLALDLETGQRIWSRTDVGRDSELIAVAGGQVFLGGAGLECRRAFDGGVVWRLSATDGGLNRCGVGFVTDHNVWWPTHREVLVVDRATGAMTRRISLSDWHHLSGGNLLSDGRHLIVAGPERLTVFSPFGKLPAGPASP